MNSNKHHYNQQQHRLQVNNKSSSLTRTALVNREHNIDALNSVDANFAYILVYTNCNNMQVTLNQQQQNNNSNTNLLVSSASNSSYDHVRTLFVLRCIEQIINKCSKEFLISISQNYLSRNATTANTSAASATSSLRNNAGSIMNSTNFSVHNEKLLDLIVRHLKSIYGNGFYSSSSNTNSNDLSFNLNNVTYIEAIILILLFYIRSYYPPSRFNLIASNNLNNPTKGKMVNEISINKHENSSSTRQTMVNSLIINNQNMHKVFNFLFIKALVFI